MGRLAGTGRPAGAGSGRRGGARSARGPPAAQRAAVPAFPRERPATFPRERPGTAALCRWPQMSWGEGPGAGRCHTGSTQLFTIESSADDDQRRPLRRGSRLARGAARAPARGTRVPATPPARRGRRGPGQRARRPVRPAARGAQRQRPLHVPRGRPRPRHRPGGCARRGERRALVRRRARHRPRPLLPRRLRRARVPARRPRLDAARHRDRRGPRHRRGRRGRGRREARGLRDRRDPRLPLPHLRDRPQRPVPARGTPRPAAHPGHRHVRLAGHRPCRRRGDPGDREAALRRRLPRHGCTVRPPLPPPGAAERRLDRHRLLLHLAARPDRRGGHAVLPRRRHAAAHPVLGPLHRRRDQLAARGPRLPALPRGGATLRDALDPRGGRP